MRSTDLSAYIICNGYWDPSAVGVWGWEVVMEGEREETGAVVC